MAEYIANFEFNRNALELNSSIAANPIQANLYVDVKPYIVGATASVSNTVGLPSCVVTVGGSPQSRTFDFAFENLKGEKGDKGDKGNKGDTGRGIYDIIKVSSSGLLDRYRILYNNGDTWYYYIRNGNGISSIEKTDTTDNVDTYTITYTNGNTETFTVTNGQDGTDGTDGQDGADGTDGVGISSIEKTSTSGLVDTYTITYTDSDTDTFTVTNGEKGEQGEQGIQGIQGETGATGNGIASISKTGTSGLVDTYTVTYTNSDTDTFTVTNGQDGTDGTDGQDGADGFSPTANVTKSGSTATITITDKNGTTTQTVTDGSDADVTSTNIVNALGYTPYDSSNPNGYTTNVGTVTKVNNTSPDANGNVSLTIPTVNNATLTIQKNGTTINTFTANASSNVTCNITVPTQASDINAQATLVSGTNIKTINNNSLLGSGNLTLDGLPSQSGNSGKFLTTNGTSASWATATKVTFRVWS